MRTTSTFIERRKTLKWTDENEEAFQNIQKVIQQITERRQFKRHQPMRIACDSSCEGLEAVTQQKTEMLQSSPLRVEFLNNF